MKEFTETSTKPKSTIPVNLSGTVQGIDNDVAAQKLGQNVMTILRVIGEKIDLSELDGFTVAVDYDHALATNDRGDDSLEKEGRTDTDLLQGVAKASLVRRDGGIKTHLIFSAVIIAPLTLELKDVPQEKLSQIVSIIAHECGHVEEHSFRNRVLPDVMLNHKYYGYRELFIGGNSEAIWAEYAACRISAPYCAESEKTFRECFEDHIPNLTERAKQLILEYYVHNDHSKTAKDVSMLMAETFRLAAYLIGHLDADDHGSRTSAIAFGEGVMTDPVLASYLPRLLEVLRSLWNSRENWVSMDEMFEIGELLLDLLSNLGITITAMPDGGAHIHILP